MLPLVLALLLALWPSNAVAIHATLLEPARHTLDLIYNMEFEAALEAAQRLIDRVPTHPAGHFYRAATYWQWRLVAVDPQQRATLLTHFTTAVQLTQESAEHLAATHAAEAAFYLGATYGLQARMHFVEQHYVRALYAAYQGSQYLQQCVTYAPDCYDAYAGLGTYHYVLARVPDVWRGIVEQLVGLVGDRDKGLHALEQARTAGGLASVEASSLLAKIYTLPGEQQYDKAYALLAPLVQRYPNNSDYRTRLGLICAYQAQWACARQMYQQLLADTQEGKPYYPQAWLPHFRYRLAEVYVFQQDTQAARPLLTALHTQTLPAALQAWVELRLGNLHDLQGERQAAQAWYQGVRGDKEAEAQAQLYLTRPFTPTPVVLKPSHHSVI
jgi:tetratricopeptide (TPR) repeat protein